MKNIIKFAVGNPVTICMVVFALLLLGKVSYDQLSVDLLPDLNNPRPRRSKSNSLKIWSLWRFGRVMLLRSLP